MHVTSSIIERKLIIEEESRQLVQQKLLAHCIVSHCIVRGSPKIASRQIKMAFFNMQRKRIATMLEEWGKLMWTTTSTTQETWVNSLLVFLLLSLTSDKILGLAYYFCECRIHNHHFDHKTERSRFRQLVVLTQRELFERCKEIFHSKFKTRRCGKGACNPIRDGIAGLRGIGNLGTAAPEERIVSLVESLQQFVKEFGTYFLNDRHSL